MKVWKTACSLIVLTLLTSCHSSPPPSDPTGIAYGTVNHGLICGISMATRSPCRLDVIVKNVGDDLQTFTISRRHYSTWANVFVDGKHFYPLPDTPVANHAIGPEEISIAPGETRKLPWCTVQMPAGSHSVSIKYWRNQSPTTTEPDSQPMFESGILRMDNKVLENIGTNAPNSQH